MGEEILVTGATGFIGRHLVNALRESGHTVHTHSLTISDIAVDFSGPESITHVFHLAARTFVPDSWRYTSSFYNVNVQGTVNVMEFCRRQNASATVLSSYVYGIPQQLPIPEAHQLSAVNPYAHTKILAEQIVRFYEREFGLRISIVRPFNLYGPGQDERFLIPRVVNACVDNKVQSIEIADLNPRRDYLHVEDLIRLLILTMEARTSGTYNAGYGESISVQQLVSLIQQLSGSSKPILCSGQPRHNEIPDVVAGIEFARETFGWAPQVTLAAGLGRLIMTSRDSSAVAQ
jgi:nucleoside-diphosphate-sugar epimerase